MKKIPFSIDFRPDIEAGKCQVITGDDMPATVQNWEFIPGHRITVEIPNINGFVCSLIYDYEGRTVAKYLRDNGRGKEYNLRLFVSYK